MIAAGFLACIALLGLTALGFFTADSRRPGNPEAGDDYDCCVWLSRYGEPAE